MWEFLHSVIIASIVTRKKNVAENLPLNKRKNISLKFIYLPKGQIPVTLMNWLHCYRYFREVLPGKRKINLVIVSWMSTVLLNPGLPTVFLISFRKIFINSTSTWSTLNTQDLEYQQPAKYLFQECHWCVCKAFLSKMAFLWIST